jgi:hypothetical protein
MFGLDGGNRKDDKVVMFLSIVVGAVEFIVFTGVVRVVENRYAGNILGSVRITDTYVHVRIKI